MGATRTKNMFKRNKLELLLQQITDREFNAIWRTTYGYVPNGERSELVKGFVAEQYDSELDGCIALTESLLNRAQRPRLQRQLVRR
jgi:hypothetical protein